MMANYQEAMVKLRNTQINKLKPAANKKIEAILKINKKNIQDDESPHE